MMSMDKLKVRANSIYVKMGKSIKGLKRREDFKKRKASEPFLVKPRTSLAFLFRY